MLLEALFAAAMTMTGLTIILFAVQFFRTFNLDQLKKLWERSKRVGQRKYEQKQKILGYQKEGFKEFSFDNGRVSVWAKNQFQANYLYETGKCKLSSLARKEAKNEKEAKKREEKRKRKLRDRKISAR